jgi:hypothetical protein
LTFAICEIDGLGTFKVLKEANTLSELSRLDIDPGIFPAVFVSRDDIDRAINGEVYDDEDEDEDAEVEDVSKLTDQEMLDICENLQDYYVEFGTYWEDLKEMSSGE